MQTKRAVEVTATDIFGLVKGKEVSGRLNSDGTITVKGKEYSSPSGAGKALLRREVNGWTFWFAKRNGEKVSLAELTGRKPGTRSARPKKVPKRRKARESVIPKDTAANVVPQSVIPKDIVDAVSRSVARTLMEGATLQLANMTREDAWERIHRGVGTAVREIGFRP